MTNLTFFASSLSFFNSKMEKKKKKSGKQFYAFDIFVSKYTFEKHKFFMYLKGFLKKVIGAKDRFLEFGFSKKINKINLYLVGPYLFSTSSYPILMGSSYVESSLLHTARNT